MKFTIFTLLAIMLSFSSMTKAQTNKVELSGSQLAVENQIKAFHQRQHEEALVMRPLLYALSFAIQSYLL